MCKKIAGRDVVVFEDRGFSGKNTKRPAFKSLIAAIEEGKITRLVCYRLDRISRSIVDFSRIWELLDRYHVQFYSVTENFDTSTPMGRAMLNIVMTFAQLERETIAERVRDNYRHRFVLGAWPGGPAPYGYELQKIVDKYGNKASSLVINDEQAKVIKRIFDTYTEDGMSLRKLANCLSDKKIHGPKREVWDSVTLSRILHNSVYVKATEEVYWHFMSLGMNIENSMSDFDGIHACNSIGQRERTKNKCNSLKDQQLAVANHEGIVDAETWLKVQEKLSENKQISLENSGKYSWLTGLLKCCNCGYSIKLNYSKADKKIYMICSGKSNLKICDNRIRIDIRELEKAIEDMLVEFIDKCPVEAESDVDRKKAEKILELECKIERLVNALSESNEVSVLYISKQIEKLHEQRELLTQNKKNAQCEVKKLDFRHACFDDKKLISKQFIESITIAGENVEINWKI